MPGVQLTVSVWTETYLWPSHAQICLAVWFPVGGNQPDNDMHRLPPRSFHVNYSGCLSDFLWVWQEREAALLKHPHKFISLPLMNLAANWQGAAKKGELSVGNAFPSRETQHTGWPAISLYNNVFKFWFDFDVYLNGRAQISQELRVRRAHLMKFPV